MLAYIPGYSGSRETCLGPGVWASRAQQNQNASQKLTRAGETPHEDEDTSLDLQNPYKVRHKKHTSVIPIAPTARWEVKSESPDAKYTVWHVQETCLR